jgi:hypothetical protein
MCWGCGIFQRILLNFKKKFWAWPREKMGGFTRVFEGGFGKPVCFVVVFLWRVCGGLHGKRGQFDGRFPVLKIFQLLEIYFPSWFPESREFAMSSHPSQSARWRPADFRAVLTLTVPSAGMWFIDRV